MISTGGFVRKTTCRNMIFSGGSLGKPHVEIPQAHDKSISKGFAFEVCIWVICQKALKEVSNGFAFGVCNLGNLANEGANLAKMSSCRRLCKPDRASKVMREESARLETSYFYPLSSLNVNSLRDDIFLSFAFCYGSLQTTTNAKSICQSL